MPGRAGYVSHAYNPGSIYQKTGNLFIGIAPVIVGSIVIYVAAVLLMPDILPPFSDIANAFSNVTAVFLSSIGSFASELLDLNNYRRFEYWVFLYVLFCVGSSMKLSKADLRGAHSGFISLVGLIFTINIITRGISSSLGNTFLECCFSLIGKSFFIFNIMIVVLLMNLLLIGSLLYFAKKAKHAF